MKETKNSSGANLGFEDKMWKAADKLRNNMDAAEYKHVVLGLVFLKYISDAFEEVHNALVNDPEKLSDPEEIDEYKMRNVFWVPPDDRSMTNYLRTKARTRRCYLTTIDDELLIELLKPDRHGNIGEDALIVKVVGTLKIDRSIM